MLAPAGITPEQADKLEIWQVGVLIGADHPQAGRAPLTGQDRLVAEAVKRRAATARPQPAPPTSQPTFGFTGEQPTRRAAPPSTW